VCPRAAGGSHGGADTDPGPGRLGGRAGVQDGRGGAVTLADASGETADGTRELRVTDNRTNDTGYVNAWSLRF
jgi:hypothetical protein